jgi:polyketide cyclase/dehydrase/lipid transport protein/DoxX-like protein
MSTAPPNFVSTPPWMIVLGWILTLLMAAGMIASSIPKLMHFKPPEGSPDFGWPQSTFALLALVEISCAILYLFPRTAALGAILLTGYLGGAVATHVRIGDFEHFYFPIIAGVLVWLGLFFRDSRVRALMPIRSYPSENDGEVGFVGVGKTIGFALLGAIVVLIGIVAVVAGVASQQPGEYNVERSITINAPASEIFPHVNNFHKWDAWSPWLKIDPNANVTYEGPESGKDAVFRWAGNLQAGEGSMTIVDSAPNERIKINLEFLKPMPNTAVTEFTFKEEGEKTTVTWKMHGQNQLLGKAAHLVMNVDEMIGAKYDEGLASLKAVVEAKK